MNTETSITILEQPAAHSSPSLAAPKSGAGGTPDPRYPPLPWPDPVDASLLLNALTHELKRFVILPSCAAEALALWILHTYAFQLRDMSTYIGIESPEKQCGKTTLLTVLAEVVHRPVTASNISPPAFFRVIEEISPTLLIDEADTFLKGNGPLRGILNSGNERKTGFFWRAANQTSLSEAVDVQPDDASAQVKRFSTWCPKAIASIGPLPDTLADRCILVRMPKRPLTSNATGLRTLDATPLVRQCLRFVSDHAQEIAAARPELPPSLSDRTADIWEPLLALADLAGGQWPKLAREAALSLSASAHEHNPVGSLLLDLFIVFTSAEVDRMFSHALVESLIPFTDRPWLELTSGKPPTERWLAQQLRPYHIKPKTLRIGVGVAKGYLKEDFMDAFRRYIPASELDALSAPWPQTAPPPLLRPPESQFMSFVTVGIFV